VSFLDYNKLLLPFLLKHQRKCCRNFSAHGRSRLSPIAARLATIALTEVEVLYCPETGWETRGVQNLCQECMLCAHCPKWRQLQRSYETRLRGQSSLCRSIRCTRCTCNGVSRVHACVEPRGRGSLSLSLSLSLKPCLAAHRWFYPPVNRNSKHTSRPRFCKERWRARDGLSVSHEAANGY